MAEDTSQEKSEEATPRKLQRARERGQVPRSRELGTASVLVASAIAMYLFGGVMSERMFILMKDFLTLDTNKLMDPMAMIEAFSAIAEQIALPILGFIAFLFLCAFLGNVLIGGITFSYYAVKVKWEKLSPLRGFKRMLGLQALVELVKSIAKVVLIIGVVVLTLYIYFDEILFLPFESYEVPLEHALELLLTMFMILCLSMVFIVSIDAPYQIWKHSKDQRMTKQEVKDERKNSDGNPEIKSRIRRLQQEIAQRQMMNDVPEADAVIVNPEHYAVALRYDLKKAKSPFVIAKGVDEIAFKIREVAKNNDVPIIVSPRLARAIYYTTNVKQEIPEPLFVAVAQVLAYIYQLNEYKAGRGKKPSALPKDFVLPKDFKLPDHIQEQL
tara:strand:- start:12866 stop:14020 length:1155 start_codon:yes stop_codon:yes gene_type:complete